jgi:hypothetical protein
MVMKSASFPPWPEVEMAGEAESPVPEGAAVFPQIPPELGVNPLLLAVLHAIVFLEGSDNEIVDAAAADEALEFIAGYLQRMRGTQLQQTRLDMNCLVTYARQAQWAKQELRFLKDFLNEYGLGGDTA